MESPPPRGRCRERLKAVFAHRTRPALAPQQLCRPPTLRWTRFLHRTGRQLLSRMCPFTAPGILVVSMMGFHPAETPKRPEHFGSEVGKNGNAVLVQTLRFLGLQTVTVYG